MSEAEAKAKDDYVRSLTGLTIYEARDRFEKDYLSVLLFDEKGSVGVVSLRSGYDRTALYRLFQKHNINPGGFRPKKPLASDHSQMEG